MTTPWEITWYICRADFSDVKYNQHSGRAGIQIGDELWRVSHSIGPLSTGHDHWSGTHIDASEEDVRLVAATPVMLAALQRIIQLAEQDSEIHSQAKQAIACATEPTP